MNARGIYQCYLDDVSSNLWNDDSIRVSAKIYYPHVIRMPHGVRVITSAEEQIRDAKAFRESLDALGATAFHRHCREARFDPGDPGRIIGVHTTYIIRGGSHLTPPYDCAMSILRQADGTWLSDAIRVSVRENSMAYYLPDNRSDRPVGYSPHE